MSPPLCHSRATCVIPAQAGIQNPSSVPPHAIPASTLAVATPFVSFPRTRESRILQSTPTTKPANPAKTIHRTGGNTLHDDSPTLLSPAILATPRTNSPSLMSFPRPLVPSPPLVSCPLFPVSFPRRRESRIFQPTRTIKQHSMLHFHQQTVRTRSSAAKSGP